jgi:heme/copper-type cytochrome/quinol oxidase subunit 2
LPSGKLRLLGLAGVCGLALYGCAGATSEFWASAGATSGLSPRGTGAAQIASLWWIILALAATIFIGVMALLLYALLRRRHRQAGSEFSSKRTWLMIIGGGIVVPVIILLVLFGLTLQTMVASLPLPRTPSLLLR